MARALIIYSHPNPKSFNAAIKQTVEEFLKEKGIEYSIRDLYIIGFNPVLSADDFIALQQGNSLEDVKKEQEFIKNADILILIFPMWWYSFPAILKGYIDGVFSHFSFLPLFQLNEAYPHTGSPLSLSRCHFVP